MKSKRKASRWFFINSSLLKVYTYGSGNCPAMIYSFDDKDEFHAKIKRLKKDGYEFIKDQA